MQGLLTEIANQGIFEIILNIFLESIPKDKPYKGRTLTFNILTSTIIYILLRNSYKSSKGIENSQKQIKQTILIITVIEVFLFGYLRLTWDFFLHLTFTLTFLFLSAYFKKIFTCCEIFIMADMHARFLELYLQGYSSGTSLTNISNILVISHCVNVIFYIILKSVNKSKFHGASAFIISVAAILGINGFNIILM